MTKKKEERLWRLHRIAADSERLKGLLGTGIAAKICEGARGQNSTRKFGECFGVTGSYINGIERGRFTPSIAFFQRLLEYRLKTLGSARSRPRRTRRA